MRDNLDSLSEVVSFSLVLSTMNLPQSPKFTDLLLDDMLVNFSSGYIVVLAQADIEVSLVITEIQIRLSTIVQYVYLTWISVGCDSSYRKID